MHDMCLYGEGYSIVVVMTATMTTKPVLQEDRDQRHYPRPDPFMAAEPRLRVMAATAAWHKSQHKKENKGAKSIGELEEDMKSAEFDMVKNERAENVEDRIDDGMKESTSKEHDSSTAEKKARARRAKRRA